VGGYEMIGAELEGWYIWFGDFDDQF